MCLLLCVSTISNLTKSSRAMTIIGLIASFLSFFLQILSVTWFLKYQINIIIRSFKNAMTMISLGINYFYFPNMIYLVWHWPTLLTFLFTSLSLSFMLSSHTSFLCSWKSSRFCLSYGILKFCFFVLEYSFNNFCKDISYLSFILKSIIFFYLYVKFMFNYELINSCLISN